jgi:hypothetical protein
MTFNSNLVTYLIGATTLCTVSLSHSAITVYTDQAAFIAATDNRATDTFAGLPVLISTPSPLSRAAGPYSYIATAGTSNFFASGTDVNPALSPDNFDAPVTLAQFTGGVNAIGGNFFGSDINGDFVTGSINVNASDTAGTEFRTIVNASTSSFIGFVSNGSILSLTFQALQPPNGDFLWASADDLMLARSATTVSPIPEPEVYATMMMGLGLVGLLARRRAISRGQLTK